MTAINRKEAGAKSSVGLRGKNNVVPAKDDRELGDNSELVRVNGHILFPVSGY